MEKKSQKQIILDHLKEVKENAKDEDGQWVREYSLRSTSTNVGWLGFQADRRVRELHQAGLIERRMSGKYAEYRYKEIEIPQVKIESYNEPLRLFELPRITSA